MMSKYALRRLFKSHFLSDGPEYDRSFFTNILGVAQKCTWNDLVDELCIFKVPIATILLE